MRNSGFILDHHGHYDFTGYLCVPGVKLVSHGASPETRLYYSYCYWINFHNGRIGYTVAFSIYQFRQLAKKLRNYVFATILGLFFAKLSRRYFFLVDDIRRLIQWASGKLFFRNTEGENLVEKESPAPLFLSWLGLGYRRRSFCFVDIRVQQ